ncbi:MAG: chemotaxis protein CheW [Thermotogota bacterium]|nr:chemotaxis protein CheW [Thermotogota bacterium]
MKTKAGIYLTLRLGKEQYGIPELKVQEIIGKTEITEIPRMPQYIEKVLTEKEMAFMAEEAKEPEKTEKSKETGE